MENDELAVSTPRGQSSQFSERAFLNIFRTVETPEIIPRERPKNGAHSITLKLEESSKVPVNSQTPLSFWRFALFWPKDSGVAKPPRHP